MADRWILSRLAAVTAEVDDRYERFEFGRACEVLYHFAWDEVCDWYLELAKATLTGPSGDTTRVVLGYVLDRLLRLLHPVIPFVTEELWSALTGAGSVMVAPWPGQQAAGRADEAAGRSWADPDAEAQIGALIRLVTEVRRFRSDQGLRPGQHVPARLTGIEATVLGGHEQSIRTLLRLEPPGADFAPTASVAAEGVAVEVDTAGAIDVAAERRRAEKDLAAARKEAGQTERKLGNDAFLSRAPADVVAKTRDRLAAARADIDRLTARLASLGQEDD